MIMKSCDCGCNVFHVNGKDKMLSCSLCSKRYIFGKGSWEEFKVEKKFKFVPTKETIIESISHTRESMSEWRKRFHIENIKKKKTKLTKEEILSIKQYGSEIKLKKEIIIKMWEKEILYLQEHKIISFEKNEHKGKLRGAHIAKRFHKDLNVIGIKNKLYFRRDKAYIETTEEK